MSLYLRRVNMYTSLTEYDNVNIYYTFSPINFDIYFYFKCNTFSLNMFEIYRKIM